MHNDELTAEQARDLRALAGAIIPPSRDYGVPPQPPQAYAPRQYYQSRGQYSYQQ